MTTSALLAPLENLLAEGDRLGPVVEAIALLDVTYERTPEADPALVALYDLIDLEPGSDPWLATLRALPSESLALLTRLATVDPADENGLEPRRTGDTDPREYLAGIANGSDFLLAAHVVPEPDELAGLRDLLRDASLSPGERVDAILALHPRAVDLCSHAYAGGPALDNTQRYYVTLRSAGDSLYVVLDQDTNQVVFDHASSEVCAAHAARLNGHPVLAAA